MQLSITVDAPAVAATVESLLTSISTEEKKALVLDVVQRLFGPDTIQARKAYEDMLSKRAQAHVGNNYDDNRLRSTIREYKEKEPFPLDRVITDVTSEMRAILTLEVSRTLAETLATDAVKNAVASLVQESLPQLINQVMIQMFAAQITQMTAKSLAAVVTGVDVPYTQWVSDGSGRSTQQTSTMNVPAIASTFGDKLKNAINDSFKKVN